MAPASVASCAARCCVCVMFASKEKCRPRPLPLPLKASLSRFKYLQVATFMDISCRRWTEAEAKAVCIKTTKSSVEDVRMEATFKLTTPQPR